MSTGNIVRACRKEIKATKRLSVRGPISAVSQPDVVNSSGLSTLDSISSCHVPKIKHGFCGCFGLMNGAAQVLNGFHRQRSSWQGERVKHDTDLLMMKGNSRASFLVRRLPHLQSPSARLGCSRRYHGGAHYAVGVKCLLCSLETTSI
jgi:hypothetical protein